MVVMDGLPVRGSVVIHESELRWRFSKSSGPGGQSVNTTDSRVELVFDVAGSKALAPILRARALERFSQERCTDRIEALYRSALAAAGSRRLRRRAQARSSANAASSASTKSHGAR